MKDEVKASGYSGENAQIYKQRKRRETPYGLIVIPLVIYLGTSVMISLVSRQQGVMPFMGGMIPYSAFTGVFSSIANICIIFMVVFFRKLGFITSLILLLAQFPLILVQFITEHNVSSLPGLFINLLTIIASILIYRRNRRIDKYQVSEIEQLTARQKLSQRLFEQTATALVNAIDAKDAYSHGHSLRVAEYSEKIARLLGKSEDECYKIYYTALLHDVGKIGILNSIINKKGKLTAEEYEIIKQHPVMGNQILSSITEYPYLSIGAHYHHERYDGRGYPEKLKGDDIPEIARIISVADAYDAMSSNRSYRDAIPQQLVREEIVKGAGTQFDPEFAQAMRKLIDLDVEYKMKERRAKTEDLWKDKIVCGEHRSEIVDGRLIIPFAKTIRLKVRPEGKELGEHSGASFILYDALDARVHDDERTIKELYYHEYCEVWLDGRTSGSGIRKIQTRILESCAENDKKENDNRKKNEDNEVSYVIEAVKRKDHAMLNIDDGKHRIEVVIALPDSSRYVYMALTGEHCTISDVSFSMSREMIREDYIPRIAEKISFIDDKPVGDIPNVQVDGYMTEASEGIPIKDRLEVSFHTMSLPTARLIWHCPYVVIYSSKDGKQAGKDYKRYATMRLDGEMLESNDYAENKLDVKKSEAFVSWDDWKEKNKQGYDSRLFITRNGNIITMSTDNYGISIQNVTTVHDDENNIYVALTGDQCALTGIKVTGSRNG